MICPICVEKFTSTLRKAIECPYCAFKCCSPCFRRFIIDPERTGNATCMSCEHILSIEYVATETSKAFEAEYRLHRSVTELSKEMSLLPATQHLVKKAREIQGLESELNKLMLEERDIFRLLQTAKSNRMQMQQKIKKYKNTGEEHKDERKSFIKRCSVIDANSDCCRGFLSAAWKCGTCDTYACSKCHQLKTGKNDPTHVCSQDDIDTVALLSDGTKPCPTCGTLISFVSGCSQMWCPGCSNAFCWKTGRPVTGTIHNPHYFEYKRRNGISIERQPGDTPCCRGDLPDLDVIRLCMSERNAKFPRMVESWRSITHVRIVTIIRYPIAANIMDNSDLRLAYLLKNSTEKHMLDELKKRIKKREKNQEINQVLQMYIDVLTDLFSTYVIGTLNVSKVGLYSQAHAIRTYANNQLCSIGKRYNNKVPNIGNKWTDVIV